MSERELWRPIPGYEKLYHISNLGRIFSLGRVSTSTSSLGNRFARTWPRKLLACKDNYANGAPRVTLHDIKGKKKRFSVSTLIHIAFIQSPPHFQVRWTRKTIP